MNSLSETTEKLTRLCRNSVLDPSVSCHISPPILLSSVPSITFSSSSPSSSFFDSHSRGLLEFNEQTIRQRLRKPRRSIHENHTTKNKLEKSIEILSEKINEFPEIGVNHSSSLKRKPSSSLNQSPFLPSSSADLKKFLWSAPKRESELLVVSSAVKLQLNSQWKTGSHSRFPVETLCSIAVLTEELVLHMLRPIMKNTGMLIPVAQSKQWNEEQLIQSKVIGMMKPKLKSNNEKCTISNSATPTPLQLTAAQLIHSTSNTSSPIIRPLSDISTDSQTNSKRLRIT